MADGFTKPSAHHELADHRRRGTFVLKCDLEFVSGKKLSQARRDEIDEEPAHEPRNIFMTESTGKTRVLEECKRSPPQGTYGPSSNPYIACCWDHYHNYCARVSGFAGTRA